MKARLLCAAPCSTIFRVPGPLSTRRRLALAVGSVEEAGKSLLWPTPFLSLGLSFPTRPVGCWLKFVRSLLALQISESVWSAGPWTPAQSFPLEDPKADLKTLSPPPPHHPSGDPRRPSHFPAASAQSSRHLPPALRVPVLRPQAWSSLPLLGKAVTGKGQDLPLLGKPIVQHGLRGEACGRRERRLKEPGPSLK